MRRLPCGVFLGLVLAAGARGPARADDAGASTAGARPVHAEPRVGLDLRVAVPDGVGATLTFARGPRLVFGVGLATALGTVAVTPEVTFAVRPASRCTPTLTAKASTIVFTPLMDGVINDQLAKIYGDQVTVAMAGRAMEVFQGLAGVDCALGGAHLVARAGYAWEPFGSVGGDNGEGDLDISNWHGPAIDLGLRWRIR